MAVTAQQVFDIAMDLIDERLDSGSISTSETVSYNVKTPSILTILQAELLKQGDQYGSFEYSHQPVDNVLGSQYDVQAFEGDDLTFEGTGSAKAYYFETDRAGTVYVEDFTSDWNVLDTIPTSGTGFTAYKGVVTPTTGATKSRLRFSGSYYYRTVNRALYEVPFASDDDVPDWRAWVSVTLPTDFKSLVEIVDETTGNYLQDSLFKWEGRNGLYISNEYSGNIRIVYRPVPAILAALTDTLQVDDVTAVTILPYGLATQLMLQENADLASFFNGRYEELKAAAGKMPPAAVEEITNLYGGFG